jgi:uncharacterized membrane protein YphA (DoxX/SURF4 family)
MSRGLFIAALLTTAALAIAHRARIRPKLAEFALSPGHPLNLAIFRIVFFTVMLIRVDVDSIVWFAGLPSELQFPPPGWGTALALLPINETSALVAARIVQVACIFGILGLFTRTAAVVVFGIGLYGLGIMQFYGKISHFHHLMWIAGVLAVSPAGAMLSVDSLLAARRRADTGDVEPPRPHLRYALPLRFVWLFMGMIYFFPGLWKVWELGLREWVLSDNLRFVMYQKWSEFGAWTPWLRIDEFPLLYRTAALGTVIFELSFIFLVFFPTGRIIALVSGLLFHNMTNAFMRISFWHLQPMYASFVDWDRVLRGAAEWMRVRPISLVFDGSVAGERRMVAMLRTVDVLGRIAYIDGRGAGATVLSEASLGGMPSDASRIVRLGGESAAARARAWAAIAAAVPALWPILPLVLAVSALRTATASSATWAPAMASGAAGGSLVPLAGAHDSGNRHHPPRPRAPRRSSGPAAIATIGGTLLLANVACGFLRINSWPFAHYPTFAAPASPEITRITLVTVDAAGRESDISFAALFPDQYGRTPARITNLMHRILAREEEHMRERRLHALFGHWLAQQDRSDEPSSVRFYRDRYSTYFHGTPDRLLERTVIFELGAAGTDRIRRRARTTEARPAAGQEGVDER